MGLRFLSSCASAVLLVVGEVNPPPDTRERISGINKEDTVIQRSNSTAGALERR